MKSYNRQQYNHGLVDGTTAAATLKTLRPARPIRVTGIGVVVDTAIVAGTTTQSSITIGVSPVGSTTTVVQETCNLTAAAAHCTHVYKDMEALDTAFDCLPGQTIEFKVDDTNSGGSVTGNWDPYFVYHEHGWDRETDYDVAYTAS